MGGLRKSEERGKRKDYFDLRPNYLTITDVKEAGYNEPSRFVCNQAIGYGVCGNFPPNNNEKSAFLRGPR